MESLNKSAKLQGKSCHTSGLFPVLSFFLFISYFLGHSAAFLVSNRNQVFFSHIILLNSFWMLWFCFFWSSLVKVNNTLKWFGIQIQLVRFFFPYKYKFALTVGCSRCSYVLYWILHFTDYWASGQSAQSRFPSLKSRQGNWGHIWLPGVAEFKI